MADNPTPSREDVQADRMERYKYDPGFVKFQEPAEADEEERSER